ncbi:MAG: hypothetical protein KIT17_12965 [Rubrivivax sp.]|nr:hypothetical protein [Rubrivivax sp.]
MKLITDPEAARAVRPRPAATTLVVRDGVQGLEVLMVRRSLQASFMPGSYVFPGGAVDTADGAPEALRLCDETAATLAQRIGAVTQTGEQAAAFAVAALRECFEESGLWLHGPAQASAGDAAARHVLRARLLAGEPLAALAQQAGLALATSTLVPWSRWVTPLGLSKRFDTLFFVAGAPPAQAPSVDAGETTTLAWVHPPVALEAHTRGEFPMEFATVRTVQSLAPFAAGGAAALLAHAAALRHLPALLPRIRVAPDGQRIAILLPGEPGYDEVPLR